MIRDPDLIHFTCIAKGTTILAEFISKDAELSTTAAKCLVKTPSFHSFFTHTVRSKTYTFLMDEPFVYFGIFDEKLENPDGMFFLKSVRDAFREVCKGEMKLEKLSSHCYQGEFNPVFHQLLGPVLDHMEGNRSPVGQRLSESGILQCGKGPIRVRSKSSEENGLNKVKNRLLGEFKIGRRNGERKENDDDGGNGMGLSRELPFVVEKNGGVYSTESKNVWKKQVWLVLSLDLIVCAILFAVWLWVCSGFQCLNN